MNGLKAGQCFLGDYSSIGLTERQYRTAKKQLSDWNLATFKGTNKGTVGTLLNTKVYDINEEFRDEQEVTQKTSNRRASDEQATTNKECNNQEGKETKRFAPPSAKEVLDYMTERGYPYPKEAESFVDYYSSNGWKVGKNPMKDWKAATRNWTKKLIQKQVAPTYTPPADYDPLASLRDM